MQTTSETPTVTSVTNKPHVGVRHLCLQEADEDRSIPLDLQVLFNDQASPEGGHVIFEGVVVPLTLSQGFNLGEGIWRLNFDQWVDLKLNIPEDFSGNYRLTATRMVETTEGHQVLAVAQGSTQFHLTLEATPDVPIFQDIAAYGLAGQWIDFPLVVEQGDADGSETIVVIIEFPEGTQLNHGYSNGHGSWMVGDDLPMADLKVLPPEGWSGHAEGTVSIYSIENKNYAMVYGSYTLDVDPLPEVVLYDLTAQEDQTLPLPFENNFLDLAHQEALSLRLEVPQHVHVLGATYQEGFWWSNSNDLNALALVPEPHSSEDFDVMLHAETRHEDRVLFEHTQSFHVTLEGVSDGWEAHTKSISVPQGSFFHLSDLFEQIDTDGSESYTVSVWGAPEGTYMEDGQRTMGTAWIQMNAIPEATTFHAGAAEAGGYVLSFWLVTEEHDGDRIEQLFKVNLTITEALVPSNQASGNKENLLMHGNQDNNIMHGGEGHDQMHGHSGNNTMYGGGGADLMFGGDQDDRMFGNAGDDVLLGGAGNDRLAGNEGQDLLYGGSGNDHLWGGAGRDLLDGGEGDDRLYGGKDDDLLYGGSGNDVLYGGPGNDFLMGGDGDDILSGGSGDDRLQGHYGNDVMYGGSGNDIFSNNNCIEDNGDQKIIYGDAFEDGSYEGYGHDIINMIGMKQGPSASLDGQGSWTVVLSDDRVIQALNGESHVLFPEETSGTITIFGGETLIFHEINEIQW